MMRRYLFEVKNFFRKGDLILLFLCLLTALTDETIQLFVPGRSGELRDVWIDFAGGVLGCGVAGMVHAVRKR